MVIKMLTNVKRTMHKHGEKFTMKIKNIRKYQTNHRAEEYNT